MTGDLVDVTGKDGMGWQVALAKHRCSRRFCLNTAVVFFADDVGGYGWSKQTRHVRRRYTCAEHLAESFYGHMHVVGDQVMRDAQEWEKHND